MLGPELGQHTPHIDSPAALISFDGRDFCTGCKYSSVPDGTVRVEVRVGVVQDRRGFIGRVPSGTFPSWTWTGLTVQCLCLEFGLHCTAGNRTEYRAQEDPLSYCMVWYGMWDGMWCGRLDWCCSAAGTQQPTTAGQLPHRPPPTAYRPSRTVQLHTCTIILLALALALALASETHQPALHLMSS